MSELQDEFYRRQLVKLALDRLLESGALASRVFGVGQTAHGHKGINDFVDAHATVAVALADTTIRQMKQEAERLAPEAPEPTRPFCKNCCDYGHSTLECSRTVPLKSESPVPPIDGSPVPASWEFKPTHCIHGASAGRFCTSCRREDPENKRYPITYKEVATIQAVAWNTAIREVVEALHLYTDFSTPDRKRLAERILGLTKYSTL